MKDKILKLMSVNGFDALVDRMVSGTVASFRSDLEKGFNGQLPPECEEASKLVESALKSRVDSLRLQIADVYEKHLSESDIDALVAFHSSPVAAKLATANTKASEVADKVGNALVTEAFKTIEPQLQKLLGDSR